MGEEHFVVLNAKSSSQNGLENLFIASLKLAIKFTLSGGLKSQILIVLSAEPEMSLPSAKIREEIQPLCPVSVFRHVPVSKSQILIVLSSEPEMSLPSAKMREEIVPLCPLSVFRRAPVSKSQILIVLAEEPEMS